MDANFDNSLNAITDDKPPDALRSDVDEDTCWFSEMQEGVPYLTKLKICVDSPNEHRTLEKIQLPVFEIEFFDLGSSSKWKVHRTYEDFTKLDLYFRTSTELGSFSESFTQLPDINADDPALFEKFLQNNISIIGEFIWRCPQIKLFLDDTVRISMRDRQIDLLTEKIAVLTVAYTDLEMKLYDTQLICNDHYERLILLENNQALREKALRFSRSTYDDNLVAYSNEPLHQPVKNGNLITSILDDSPTTHPQASKYFPASLLPNSRVAEKVDATVDMVMSLLMPSEAQLIYRASAQAFLSHAVNHSLNAKVFETGLHALHIFLPNDPIRLSVLLCRGSSTNWLPYLACKLRSLERLPSCGSPGEPESVSPGSMVNIVSPFLKEENLHEFSNFDFEKVLELKGDHLISNIQPLTFNGRCRMLCAIDSLQVEIVPNARSDLCFLAFIEEIAQQVGKNELFKRSLLLIRAWWTYETTAYVEESTKNLLSDSVISVLVCSIFNQYHAVIHQPLQALCMFLEAYSNLQWGELAVTLQGVVPFHTKTNLDNQPCLRMPLPGELLTLSILQMHCDLYHMSHNRTSTPKGCVTPKVNEVNCDTSPSWSDSTTNTTSCTTSSVVSQAPTRGCSPIRHGSFTSPLDHLTPNFTPNPSSVDRKSLADTLAAAAGTLLLAVNAEIDCPTLKKTSSESQSFCPSSVRNFQKRVMNIVHPLTNANMVLTTMTSERAATISQIFEQGATDLSAALASFDVNREGDVEEKAADLNSFFKVTISKYSSEWRPDVFNIVPGQTPPLISEHSPEFTDSERSPHSTEVQVKQNDKQIDLPIGVFPKVFVSELFENIYYMDMVLVGRVSESALLSLSLDILAGKGFLPVGEIGKSLQDIAPTRNLSGKIKEKYGGLKKFLEKYPEEVVICSDHPFNPHVFLRKQLKQVDIDLIEKGFIPLHFRQAKVLRNKMRLMAPVRTIAGVDSGWTQSAKQTHNSSPPMPFYNINGKYLAQEQQGGIRLIQPQKVQQEFKPQQDYQSFPQGRHQEYRVQDAEKNLNLPTDYAASVSARNQLLRDEDMVSKTQKQLHMSNSRPEHNRANQFNQNQEVAGIISSTVQTLSYQLGTILNVPGTRQINQAGDRFYNDTLSGDLEGVLDRDDFHHRNGDQATRQISLIMQLATQNYSERDFEDRIEREREMGINLMQRTDQPYFSENIQKEEREKERVTRSDNDHGSEFNTGLFSPSFFGNETSSEYYNQPQEYSLNRVNSQSRALYREKEHQHQSFLNESQAHSYEQEHARQEQRDRQHQILISRNQQLLDEERELKEFLTQKQKVDSHRLGFLREKFNPQKWI